MNELTPKQEKVLDVLKNKFDGTGFAEELEKEIEDMSVQAIRVILSSLVSKNLCSKEKDIFENKEKTRFTVK